MHAFIMADILVVMVYRKHYGVVSRSKTISNIRLLKEVSDITEEVWYFVTMKVHFLSFKDLHHNSWWYKQQQSV